MMEDACEMTETILLTRLVYDDINFCRTRTVTEVAFVLPIAMTTVKTENLLSFEAENSDECCRSFVNGDNTLENTCDSEEIELTSELIYNGINTCQTRKIV